MTGLLHLLHPTAESTTHPEGDSGGLPAPGTAGGLELGSDGVKPELSQMEATLLGQSSELEPGQAARGGWGWGQRRVTVSGGPGPCAEGGRRSMVAKARL